MIGAEYIFAGCVAGFAVYFLTSALTARRRRRNLKLREKNTAHIMVIPAEELAYTLPVQRSRFVSTGFSFSTAAVQALIARTAALMGLHPRLIEKTARQARRELLVRLKEQCADALCITGVRFEFLKGAPGKVEALIYGTALYSQAVSPAAYRMAQRDVAEQPQNTPPPGEMKHTHRAVTALFITTGLVWLTVAGLYVKPALLGRTQEKAEAAPSAPKPEPVVTQSRPAAPALPDFSSMGYSQLTAASKALQKEYDAAFRHFQGIYSKGTLDNGEYLAKQLAALTKAEELRTLHYAHALEVLARTRKNIDDMASAMKASPQLAAAHTDRIEQLTALTRKLAEAERAQLEAHRGILGFLKERQGAYTLAANNVIRFSSGADNTTFNTLNRALLEAESARNSVAEQINALVEAQP